MNQLEISAQESAALRVKYAEIVGEKQRLERDVQELRQQISDMHCRQGEVTKYRLIYLVSLRPSVTPDNSQNIAICLNQIFSSKCFCCNHTILVKIIKHCETFRISTRRNLFDTFTHRTSVPRLPHCRLMLKNHRLLKFCISVYHSFVSYWVH